jgi:hypothetical protein
LPPIRGETAKIGYENHQKLKFFRVFISINGKRKFVEGVTEKILAL